MQNLKPGDSVECRIKASTIVSPYRDYDEIRSFEIIASDDFGYYIYVPAYFLLKDTKKADRYQCEQLGISSKFLNEEFIYIQENMIAKINSILDGMHCDHCKEFFLMAASNQDNGTLICYSCRFNQYR